MKSSLASERETAPLHKLKLPAAKRPEGTTRKISITGLSNVAFQLVFLSPVPYASSLATPKPVPYLPTNSVPSDKASGLVATAVPGFQLVSTDPEPRVLSLAKPRRGIPPTFVK